MTPTPGLAPATPLGKRVPMIYQHEAVECGAASLAMVLGYHGKWVPLEALRVACGVSRDGSKASNLLRAARGMGLDAKGFKRELHELRDLPLPWIVFWNFNHFVVVTGIDAASVHINDPGHGRRRVSHAEFGESFTGVVLTFGRTQAFEPAGRKPRLIDALARRLSSVREAVSYLGIVGVGLVLPGMVVPMFGAIFVDRILLESNVSWRDPFLTLVAFTALLVGVLTWLQNRILLRTQSRLAMLGAGQFFWHVLRLPIEFFTQRYAGEIAGRVALNDSVARVVAGDLPRVGVRVLAAAVFLLLLFLVDWVLGLIVLAVSAVNVLMLLRMSSQLLDSSQKVGIAAGKAHGATTSGLTLIESLKATGSESAFFERWAGFTVKYLNAGQDAQRATLLLGRLPGFLGALAHVAVISIGGWRAMQGDLSIGLMVAAQSLTDNVVGPLAEAVSLLQGIQQVDGSIKRLDDVLVYPVVPALAAPAAPAAPPGSPAGAHAAAPPSPLSPPSPGRYGGRLTFEDVTFSYSRDGSPIVDGLGFDVLPGQRVAIVGGSGSGKSTLLKLLVGLYQPRAGRVLFDGLPREAYDRVFLARAVSFVDQDVYLFEGTIRDNLTLWNPDVSEGDLIRAAQDACILDEITRRPGGFDAAVEEGGRNFSGGQRQRLEIARALVTNPSLLILDEATSALDPVTERLFDSNLRRRGCTVVCVAHRLSTIRDADEILVMAGGRLAERGTHDTLMTLEQGLYRRLVGTL